VGQLQASLLQGKSYKGVIKYGHGSALGRSPAGLINHLKSHGIHRQSIRIGSADDDDDEGDQVISSSFAQAATDDWVCHVVIGELQDFRLSRRHGVQKFLKRWCKPGVLGGYSVKSSFDRQVKACRDVIKEKEKKHHAFGGKFAMSADSWKAKSRCQTKQYLAVNCHWITGAFEWQEACISVQSIDGQCKNSDGYERMLVEALNSVELQPADITAGVADHESALRKALVHMKVPAIGCECHFLQLPPKHVLPPIKKKKAPSKSVQRPEVQEADEDSNDDDSGSASESDVADLTGRSHETFEYPRLRLTDPERVKLIEKLTPLAETIREGQKHLVCK